MTKNRIPTYDTDLFAPEALRDPFAHYRALRDLGPVCRLERPDVFVLSRYEDVRNALRASDILMSGRGVGFSDEFNTPRGPNIIQSDGQLHSRLKTHVLRPLLPAQLRQHRERMREAIGERVRSLVGRGPFEAMEKLARFLPVTAISELVGLPEDGRARMLDWAAATFNAIGLKDDGFAGDYALLGEAQRYLGSLDGSRVREGSWASGLFAAAASGRLTEAEARGALSAYVLPSLDTTILAKGHLLYNLARAPTQWAMLKEDADLVPAAVVEGVRHSSVIRWFSRVAREDYPVGDHVIPQDARVMLIYPSANRDERRFADPDAFDVTRDARDQLGWGTGEHTCAGLNLAKMEMEVLLEALLAHCDDLVCGEPVIGENRGLYGFTSLPLELSKRTA